VPTDAQVGANQVIVRVTDSNSIPASSTQAFTIRVKSIPPRVITLTVVNGYDQKSKRTLLTDGRTSVVTSSDNNRLETGFGSYTSYDFSDVSLPEGARIASFVVYVEHFEEERFPLGKLQWNVGAGWPANPAVWISTVAPIHDGELSELVDSWDITSFVNTPEKINSVQLQVKNNTSATRRNTLVDRIYAVLEWDWPVPREKPIEQPEVEYELEDELVLIR